MRSRIDPHQRSVDSARRTIEGDRARRDSRSQNPHVRFWGRFWGGGIDFGDTHVYGDFGEEIFGFVPS